MVAILQQHDGFLRRFQSDRAMLRAVYHVRRNFAEGNRVKRIKFAEPETHAQHTRQRVVQPRLGSLPSRTAAGMLS